MDSMSVHHTQKYLICMNMYVTVRTRIRSQEPAGHGREKEMAAFFQRGTSNIGTCRVGESTCTFYPIMLQYLPAMMRLHTVYTLVLSLLIHNMTLSALITLCRPELMRSMLRHITAQ
jgi:hypothetical protein